MINLPAFLIFIFCLWLLALITHQLRQWLIGLCLLVFNSNSLGIKLYSLIFLPGTLVHELAHFFTAAILLVPTGRITIFPQAESDHRVRLGSVQIAKTDFIRSSLIGLAPIIIGLLALFIISSLPYFQFLNPNNFTDFSIIITQTLQQFKNPFFWLFVYLLLAISNTMFTSREDRRSLPILIGFLSIGFLVALLLGKINQTISLISSGLNSISFHLIIGLLLAIFLNTVFLSSLFIVVKLFSRLLNKKIIIH